MEATEAQIDRATITAIETGQSAELVQMINEDGRSPMFGDYEGLHDVDLAQRLVESAIGMSNERRQQLRGSDETEDEGFEIPTNPDAAFILLKTWRTWRQATLRAWQD